MTERKIIRVWDSQFSTPPNWHYEEYEDGEMEVTQLISTQEEYEKYAHTLTEKLSTEVT